MNLPTLTCILILFFIAVGWTIAANIGSKLKSATSCGYKSCTKNDPDRLNIHLVAHTHDDVGWLKTVDQYYFGKRNDIQRACVRDIIDTVVEALVKDPKRKFIYVETAFLWKWLQLQDEQKLDTMKMLVNEGRLEIIGGGWSMNDEATTHYQSLVDQYTWGFRRLNDTFGECARPRIGWQIDPFGHSREQASMFAQLGFDGLFLGRIDYQDKNQRLKDKTMEFVWEGSPNLGSSANIFTSVLYNLYQPPKGFCFDTLCGGTTPINDDPSSSDYNLPKMVSKFLKFVDEQSSKYVTNNVLLTMGGDFTYQDAELSFKNIDKLISGINKLNGTKYKAFYSTPSCYLQAVREKNLTWTAKSDDFFPYAMDPNAYWTGYFTSRPALKFFERMGNNFLQVVKQLAILTDIEDSHELQLFREIMGVLQHHDAVSGTEKQHVADDYALMLYRSIKDGEHIASEAMRKLTSKNFTNDEEDVQFHSCLQLNVSSCKYSSEHSRFVVTIYNPTSQPLDTYVRLPVQQSHYDVRDFNGKEMVTQIVPIPKPLLNLSTEATHELVFQATNITALSFQSFYVQQRNSTEDNNEIHDQTEINNEHFRISVNDRGNVVVKATMSKVEYEQSFEYYRSANKYDYDTRNYDFSRRSSGAYIFRPKDNYSQSLEIASQNRFRIFKGPLFEEIHQEVNDWISQVVRIYHGHNEEYVEFDWLVGPIPIHDNQGKELITKYSSNLRNEAEFTTDSNGREMLKRQLNRRPTWDLKLNESIPANYYPVNSKINIEDKNTTGLRISVLTDRSQGGSSLVEGQIELMLHRRMISDDGFGVDEALNENDLIVRGRHVIVAGSLQERDRLITLEKEQAVKLSLRPWIFITPADEFTFDDWNERYRMVGDSLIGPLPKNIRILTLEPWKDGQVLLRLEHLFELDESSEYSQAELIDIQDLFPEFIVVSVNETALGADRYVKHEDSHDTDDFKVSLKPMEIRTFLLRLGKLGKIV